MYSARPNSRVTRQLNRHASTVLLGGIFLTFSVVFFMAMCKMPCEHARMEHNLLQSIEEFHGGQKSTQREVKIVGYGESAKLVILIISGPGNEKRRSVIRKTWLSVSYPNVTHLFVVASAGLPSNVSRALQMEQSSNNDLLLLATMRDSYKDLTTKVMETFKWLNKNMAYQYILKVDDDSFARVDVILEELKHKPNERLYWGFFDGRANVKKSGQWAENNWVLCDKYLPHARGGGYILSSDLVTYIVRNADYLQRFMSEDISVGAWLGPLKITRLHDPRFDTEYVSRGCNNQYIVTHKQSIDLMLEKWANLQSSGLLCTKEVKLKNSYVYNWKAFPSNCCIRNDTSVP